MKSMLLKYSKCSRPHQVANGQEVTNGITAVPYVNLLPLKRHGNEETAVACLTCLCFSLVCPAVSLRWWEHINRKIKEYLCLTVPYSTDALINDAITSSVQLQSHEQLSQLNYQDRCLQVQVRLCTSKKKHEYTCTATLHFCCISSTYRPVCSVDHNSQFTKYKQIKMIVQ